MLKQKNKKMKKETSNEIFKEPILKEKDEYDYIVNIYSKGSVVWFLRGTNTGTMILSVGKIVSHYTLTTDNQKHYYLIKSLCEELDGWSTCTVLDSNILENVFYPNQFTKIINGYKLCADKIERVSGVNTPFGRLLPSPQPEIMNKKVWLYSENELSVGVVLTCYSDNNGGKTICAVRPITNEGKKSENVVMLTDRLFFVEDNIEACEAVKYYKEKHLTPVYNGEPILLTGCDKNPVTDGVDLSQSDFRRKTLELAKADIKECPKLRLGQAIYNVIRRELPDLLPEYGTKNEQGRPVDCFYNDDFIDDFLTYTYQKFRENH